MVAAVLGARRLHRRLPHLRADLGRGHPGRRRPVRPRVGYGRRARRGRRPTALGSRADRCRRGLPAGAEERRAGRRGGALHPGPAAAPDHDARLPRALRRGRRVHPRRAAPDARAASPVIPVVGSAPDLDPGHQQR